MSKVEETNFMIDYITKLKESGLNVDNTIMLADIAKSLAMIADKLCEAEVEVSNAIDQAQRIENVESVGERRGKCQK